jgi:hypothetical protein
VDLVTRADIAELTRGDRSEIRISLFMPTHRFGSSITTDRLCWRTLVDRVESVLADRGTSGTDIDALLAPARELRDDGLGWQFMSDGLALFCAARWHRAFRLPVDVPLLATIGDRFVVGPLRGQVIGSDHFLLLALSGRRVRLFECSRTHIEEVELDDMPTSLRELARGEPVRSHTMTRLVSSGTGGRPGRAVFFGHGGDSRPREDDRQAFLRQVDNGLQPYLDGEMLPLVLIGPDDFVADYRKVSTYANVLDQDVRRDPDELSNDELHDVVWPIVRATLDGGVQADLDRFSRQIGTGLASMDADAIADAARHGRVESLLLAAGPWRLGGADGVPQVVELGRTPEYARAELIDAAATDTATNGGRVHVLPRGRMPELADLAAILRY